MCISVNDKKKIFPSYSNSRVSTCGCCSSLWLAFQVPFSLLLYLAAIWPMHTKFKIKSMRYVYFVHQLQLLKGPSEGPLIPKQHKKTITVYSWTQGQNTTCGCMSCELMKLNLKCLIMFVTFGQETGELAWLRAPSQLSGTKGTTSCFKYVFLQEGLVYLTKQMVSWGDIIVGKYWDNISR